MAILNHANRSRICSVIRVKNLAKKTKRRVMNMQTSNISAARGGTRTHSSGKATSLLVNPPVPPPLCALCAPAPARNPSMIFTAIMVSCTA